MTIIQCPKCQKSLPGNAGRCHFCGDPLQNVIRPVAPIKAVRPLTVAPKWVWTAYYLVAAYIALSGLFEVGSAFVQAAKPVNGEPQGLGVFGIVAIVFGLISVAIGIGLAARNEFFRGVANFLCGLRILFGLFGLIVGFPIFMVLGIFGALMFLLKVLDIATAAFMIYLIGETD